MISFELARALQAAGLAWQPSEGDRFVLPGRELDGRVFTISEMVVEVRTGPVGQLIAFNGTTEWALDAIEQAETVWLPRESQLREALGAALLSLVRADTTWRCTCQLDGAVVEYDGDTAEAAYAHALLALLRSEGPQA